MNRWAAALGTAVIFGGLTWLLVGILVYAVRGCDEGPCPEPAWAAVVHWGVPMLVVLSAGTWGWRRAERTRRALGPTSRGT
jgi:hypothetical protein